MRAVLIEQVTSLAYELNQAIGDLEKKDNEFSQRRMDSNGFATGDLRSYTYDMIDLRSRKRDFWENAQGYFENLHDPERYSLEDLDFLVGELLTTLHSMDRPITFNFLDQLSETPRDREVESDSEYVIHFKRGVKQEAIRTLRSNREELDRKEKMYRDAYAYDTNSSVLAETNRLFQKLREIEGRITANENRMRSMGSPSVRLRDPDIIASYGNEVRRLRAQTDDLEAARESILALTPELGVLGRRFEAGGDNQALLEELSRGFAKARRAMEEAREKVISEDVPFEALAPVILRVKREFGVVPDGTDPYSVSVNNWLRTLRRRDGAIKIVGTLLSLAGFAALFISGIGTAAAIGIGFAGAAIGGASSLYSFERADDLRDMANSQIGASGTLVNDPEAIRREYTWAIVDLVLSGVDLGGAAFELAKVFRLVGRFQDAHVGSRVVLQLDNFSDETMDVATRLFNGLDETKSQELLEYIGRHNDISQRLDVVDDIGLEDILNPAHGPTIEDRILNITIRDLGDARMRNVDIIKRLESSQPTGRGVYRQENLQKLESFQNDAEMLLQREGIPLEDFQRMKELPVDQLSQAERELMRDIREMIPSPTSETLMQKVIKAEDIDKYLSGDYSDVRGFVTNAADTKSVSGSADVYESLRLDYDDISFSPDGEFYGVIRFKTENAGEVDNAFSPLLGGNNTNAYPSSGHGFTTTRNGKIIPEYMFPDGKKSRIMDGAELYRVNRDGSEVLLGIYVEKEGRFVPYDLFKENFNL